MNLIRQICQTALNKVKLRVLPAMALAGELKTEGRILNFIKKFFDAKILIFLKKEKKSCNLKI